MFVNENNVLVPSTLYVIPWGTRPTSIPHKCSDISRYLGQHIKWWYCKTSPMTPLMTTLAHSHRNSNGYLWSTRSRALSISEWLYMYITCITTSFIMLTAIFMNSCAWLGLVCHFPPVEWSSLGEVTLELVGTWYCSILTNMAYWYIQSNFYTLWACYFIQNTVGFILFAFGWCCC